MDLKELRIGESLEIISKNIIGRYEGPAADGKAKVSSEDQTYLVEAVDLRLYVEPKIEKVKQVMNELNRRSDDRKIGVIDDEIDLHIKVLNPSLINGLPEHILNHQLMSCKSFLDNAIKSRIWSATIIHGKGAGVLRAEVANLLKKYVEVDRAEAIKGNGAQRVYFKY